MLLKEGRYLEETVRDLDAAIRTYKRVRQLGDDDADVDPRSIAQSDLAVARCMVRKGKQAEARQRLKIVIREYPRFAGLVSEAQQLLQRIPAADPAAFMPADTLIYAELTQPWAHMERIVKILAQADVARLFGAHQEEGQANFPLDAIFSHFTLNQLPEIKKIEALAVGIIEFQANRPKDSENPYSEFIVVLFPGQSRLVKSLITNMTQAMTKIDHQFDCDIFEVPGTGSQIHLAVGQDVFLLGAPLSTVIDALARPRADQRNALADNEDFRRQAAARRQDSAIITYGNLARIVPIIRTLENRGNFDNLNAVLDLDSVDYLMARVDLDHDRLIFEATALLNEDRPNAFYEFWKSDHLDQAACRYIHEDATLALSVAVEDGRRKWDQLFDIVGKVFRANDRPDPRADAFSVLQQLETVLDSDDGRAALASLQSLTFVLPGLDTPTPPGVDGIMDRLVLIGNTGSPELVEKTIEMIADGLARCVQEDRQAVAKREAVMIDQTPAVRFHLSDEQDIWSVVRLGGLVIASPSEAGIQKCVEAKELGKSILNLPLDHPLRRLPKNTHKFGFLRVDRVLKRLADQNRIQEIPPENALPTVFSTIEKPNELIIRMEINDLPKVIRGVTDIMLQRFDRAVAQASPDHQLPSESKSEAVGNKEASPDLVPQK